MARGPQHGPSRNKDNGTQPATGGTAGVAQAYFAELAARLLDNGYAPIPIHPRSKKPVPAGWPNVPIDDRQIEAWQRSCGHCGIGLRTGHLVGIDIDHLDLDISYKLAARASSMFGSTLIRVGLRPKQLLVYRIENPITKLSVPHLEILGTGQQFVAHGIHPTTGAPYEWITGEGPCEVPFDQLPLVDEAGLNAFLAEAAGLYADKADDRRPSRNGQANPVAQPGPTRNSDGLVTDGRDGWLSSLAFHAVHDALDRHYPIDPQRLAEDVWARFAATTDISRPQKDGRCAWTAADAARKISEKLDLLNRNRLPPRNTLCPEPEDPEDLLCPDHARDRLSKVIEEALKAATGWWSGDQQVPAPVIGIRATVGLGKSAISRDQIADWQRNMKEQGQPYRVLVVTPSHALAEEAAGDWIAKTDGPVAVHRGYDAIDPRTRSPMCQDRELVKMALREDLGVGKSVCYSSQKWHCQFYEGCLKQTNKRDVASAQVVLAAYDVLFTGVGAGDVPFGLILVDEGCWQRAEDKKRLPPVERLATVGLTASAGSDHVQLTEAIADLAALRVKVQSALVANGPGAVIEAHLSAVGMTSADCDFAADLELLLCREPKIYPGMKPRARAQAAAVVKRNETARRLIAMWRALATLLGGAHPESGVLRIEPPDPKTELHRISLHNHLALNARFAGLPILHLDATLRPDLAGLILPGVKVTRIDAEQVHQKLTLVPGRFGKATLCAAPDQSTEEQGRRANRLSEVVDYVGWQALRVGSRDVLVITHQEIEGAFSGIKGVQTAHFNAIAGLDQYRDVRLLIVVGRPLPSSDALYGLRASFFREMTDGRYRHEWRSVRLRNGGTANLRVVSHEDGQAELLRAAICDDEIIQAIGRGRGVNRSVDNPLEVHLLADVALPLIHDRVVAWEAVVPGDFQRMLLAGVAVDSPTDAAALHPQLFANAKQAQKAFERSGFKRQIPIGTTYREMSLKSAQYLRGGRGRSWQKCWWVDGDQRLAREELQHRLGLLAGWRPWLG